MDGQLKEKVIIITGGAMGIGFALSKGCAEHGATVIMCDINKKLELQNLQAQGLSWEVYILMLAKRK